LISLSLFISSHLYLYVFFFSFSKQRGEPVWLNVYDLMIMNYTINKIGIGVYHTGVEIYGREYSYAGHYHTESTGLKESLPRDTSWLQDAIWKERVYVGKTQKSRAEVRELFEQFKPQYLGPSYNVLEKNCNHFTDKFCRALTGSEIPEYVQRIMRVAKKVRPCLPGMFTSDLRDQTPPAEYDSHKHTIPQPRNLPPEQIREPYPPEASAPPPPLAGARPAKS
jgi:deubiquitinase DESI2